MATQHVSGLVAYLLDLGSSSNPESEIRLEVEFRNVAVR